MDKLSKRDRLEAVVSGGPVDRPAVALWRHWPVDDQYSDNLVRATLAFQRDYDFDLIKMMPSSNYCILDWGAQSHWEGNFEGTREWGPRVIQKPEDWMHLRLLDPYQGMLDEIRRAVLAVGAHVGEEVPFIQTIFSPLAQAKNLAGNEQLLTHLRRYPDMVKVGLGTITETTIRFIEAIRESGLSGIFLALQHATYNLLNESEYRDFGRPYDLRILDAAGDFWFNLLHVHGDNVMFDLVADYPVQAINWHDQETPPSLVEALGVFPGALAGGLHRHRDLLQGTPDLVRQRVRQAVEQTGGRRLIIAAGCVTLIPTPVGNIRAAREAVG